MTLSTIRHKVTCLITGETEDAFTKTASAVARQCEEYKRKLTRLAAQLTRICRYCPGLPRKGASELRLLKIGLAAGSVIVLANDCHVLEPDH